MTIAYICGFETGDASEMNTLAAGSSIQGTTVRTGAYALKAAAALSKLQANSILAATQSVIRFYLNVPALPGVATTLLVEATGASNRMGLRFNASNKLEVFDGGATLGLTTTAGTASFNTGQWYRIELALDLAASGVVKIWVDGVLDINTTHTNDVSASLTGSYQVRGAANPNEYFWDDIRIDTGTVSPPGAGQIIARQGLTGTPTYDSWTKVGAATAALCWSDTPFSITTNCTSIVSAQAQTMLVEKFSITQTGHGTQVVGSGDTINAAKTALIVKEATAGGGSIRRRVNGTDTDTATVPTTADKYFDDGIWTTSVANLDLLEAGYVKSGDVNLTTVEDVWVIVDYTPAVQAPLFIADLSIPPPKRYPVENRGFTHATDVQLLGQDKFYRGAGQAPNVFDWRVPPDRPRARSLADPQNQYVRIIGQESGFTKFVPDLSIPPPVKRLRTIADPQNQRAQYIPGKETLPGFVADLSLPAPLPRRVRTLDSPQSQRAEYITGRETLPGFNAEWKVPARPIWSLDLRGFIKDLDIQLLGQDRLPNFQADLRIPPPVRRNPQLGDTQSPSFPALLLIGQETLPRQFGDLIIPARRLFARSLLDWTGEPIPPTPAPPAVTTTQTPPSGGIGMRRFGKKGRLRYPEAPESPFVGYTTEQLQRMVELELPRLDKAEWRPAEEALEAKALPPQAIDLLPEGFDLMRARAIEIGAGLILAELRAQAAKRAEEDDLIAMLLLFS